MPRPIFAPVTVFCESAWAVLRTLWRQGILSAALLTTLVLTLALLFAFLAYNAAISPFIYPLF